ncbi:MAG: ATP-binding protein [Zoogloeaceae bacterium]|jgi:AAA15 family ATPase/GTPase|nr:ATP-binding protein [Zoogloeaceae bacterium]
MQFKFENLGLLDEADIQIADLTVICGENNTGKTYATYAIYGFLRIWRQLLAEMFLKVTLNRSVAQGKYQFDLQKLFSGKVNNILESIGKKYSEILHRVFATDAEFFKNTVFVPSTTDVIEFTQKPYQRRIQNGPAGKLLATIRKEKGGNILEMLVADEELHNSFGMLNDFITDAIADIVFAPYLPSVRIASAERTGAAIFRKELDMARTRMLKALNEIDSKELKRNPFKILQQIDADYAWPVEDNVDFVRQLEDIDKQVSSLAKDHPEILDAFNGVIGGSYRVKDKRLFFQTGKKRFTMNESSSCVRALLDVGFYLRCEAKPGDLFIIDEPELNLHPKNQRAFARLVARLVNAGIKVFITTHSDYLIKEFNTLIMLNQKTEHTKSIQREYLYDDTELLDPDRIRLYMTGKNGKRGPNTLLKANIYPDRGIEVTSFDNTIEAMNEIQEKILYEGEF